LTFVRHLLFSQYVVCQSIFKNVRKSKSTTHDILKKRNASVFAKVK